MSKKTMFLKEELKDLGLNDAQVTAVLKAHNENNDEVHDDKETTKASVPINCVETMQTTSLFDLQNYSKGVLVRFPDFAEGQPFVARVRRPSMLVLAKQGKIPNALLMSANALFSKGGSALDNDDDDMLSDIYGIIEIICESALKEPTYQQIKDAGLELSDDQLMAIFNYTQTGVKALESFRQK